MQLYTFTNAKISLHLQSPVSKQYKQLMKNQNFAFNIPLFINLLFRQQRASDALGREIYENIHLPRGSGVGLARYAAAKLGDNFDRANIFRPSLSTFVRVDI